MNHIKTQATGRGTEIVIEEFIYRDVVLGAGFESDGATVPRILWTLYPPFYPDYKTASMVHDHLCRLEQYSKADEYFNEILLESGVKDRTRKNLLRGVMFWHKIAYKKNKPRSWLNIYLKLKGSR